MRIINLNWYVAVNMRESNFCKDSIFGFRKLSKCDDGRSNSLLADHMRYSSLGFLRVVNLIDDRVKYFIVDKRSELVKIIVA